MRLQTKIGCLVFMSGAISPMEIKPILFNRHSFADVIASHVTINKS